MAILENILAQLTQQLDTEKRQQDLMEMLSRNLNSQTQISPDTSEHSRIPLSEDNLTFSSWSACFEDRFSKDAKSLDDNAKVRLLLRKLNHKDYTKYADYILSEKPKDLDFHKPVQQLKFMLDKKESLFSIRYKCLSTQKSDLEDFVSYGSRVNKHPLWRLTLIENDPDTLTLDKLVEEAQRYKSLKEDVHLGAQSGATVVNEAMESIFNKKHGARKREFQKSDLVFAQMFRNGKVKWCKGQIIERVGSVIYNVLIDAYCSVNIAYKSDKEFKIKKGECWNNTLHDF
ncbi:uncharacterized protein LOC142230860 [Haematobia irritans]|uniref:uncharacterized protein LOC142230860 n=1 Tax=Haematobia irritans TaxID=7368 RepID=UPI003F50CDD3